MIIFSFPCFVEQRVKNKDRYFKNLPQICVYHRREVPRHEAVDLHAGMHKDETEQGMHWLCDWVKDGVAEAMVQARCNISALIQLSLIAVKNPLAKK
jgi:hypothetical protein